ncbi:retrotransposon protein, putative, ty1-copia subclass [Tanacetum coccineum]|uniref:Retrotransposon protein, putative, ty1-copia subclass n=1 Tax=Tanacetum coccineum TaxID=301880 RepID=A0ABQ5G9P4_9ASTR
MTTTVVNNSLFRSLFEKQKLTGNNFMEWYRNLRIVLSTEDKLPFLEQPIPTLPVPPEGQANPPDVVTTHQAWVKAQKEIVGLMLMTMDPDIQKNLEHLGAFDMLKELKTLYVQQADQELLQTVREFHTYKQEEGQSVSSYVLKMKSYIDNLERLGHAMTQNLSVSLILVSLRKEYDGFVQNYNMHSMGKIVIELHAMLKQHEQTLPLKEVAPALHAIRAGRIQKNQKKKSHKAAKGNQGKGKAKMGYALVQVPPFAPKPKNPPTPKKDNLEKDVICHQCGEVGHWRRNCPIYLAELMKKKKLSQGASTSGKYETEARSYKLCTWAKDIMHIVRGGCMSGKMARKPYSHQVERAKDLLGLIHTDVCGPFKIMSRQRASYFITLSDDFSRYGYVYLLKHKHEVFETFNVFQKELEYQLGKTIKLLCSDRGCEYISQEFLDHLRDHGIIANRTPPYMPQHNGVDYALESAACILNMVSTKKVDKTPYKVWHEQALKLSYLKVWGYEALVKRDTLTKPDKLKPISIKCIFVGYPKETMGYSFYYPPENKVFVAWNAEFLEHSLINQEANGDQEIDEPQSDINTICRSTRTRRPTDRLFLYVDAEKHELGDLGEPANYKAALLDPESNKWINAKNVEMQSHIRKRKSGIVFYDYEIWQMDVKTAFLNGYLNEEVHIEQPEGFVNQKLPNRECKLKRSIYGLNQASRQWNKRFDDEIKKFRFGQNRDEPCVYVKASGSYVTFLILYVDDILIMGNNIPMLQDVKSYLGRCFAMKNLGEAAYILGIKIYRDRSKRLIGLCQSAYIEKILKRFYMENSKRGTILMQEKLKLSKSQGASTPAEIQRMQNIPYASAIGSIMYAVRCTRPDVAFAQNITSRFQQNPGELHWTTVKNILKHLRNTKDMFLTGYVFIVNGGVVDWKSTKQSIFATSSTDVEYIAAFDASKEAIWIRKFIFGLGVVPTTEEPISMYCDNIRAIAIAKDHRVTKDVANYQYICKPATLPPKWELLEFMTTTVVNNSLFRSLFEKQKLTGNNFIEWYRNLRIVLSTEDKLPFLEQSIPTLPVPPQGKANPPDVITTHQEDQELLQTAREFHACKQEEWQLIVPDSHQLYRQLGASWPCYTQNLSVSLILVSLRKEYDGFVQNYNMHSTGKTINELHAMLKLHEQTLPPKEVGPALHAIRAGRIQKNQKKKSHKAAKGNQGKGKAKMGYAPVHAPPFAPKPKNPPTPNKDNPAKDAICH